MALVRLAYAADLPPTDKLVRDLLDGNSPSLKGEGRSGPAGDTWGRGHTMDPHPTRSRGSTSPFQGEVKGAAIAPQVVADTGAVAAPHFRSLEDLAAFAAQKGAPVLKVHIENDIHLIRLEPGRIEFRPSARAPHSLAADLSQKLKDWTGMRWVVSVSCEGGAPTIAEAKRAAAQAKLDAVAQEPLVRAVLDRFPGAEIVGVHDRPRDAEITPEPPEDSA